MKTLFYNTSSTERKYFEREAPATADMKFIGEPLSARTVDLAKQFDAISIGSTDDVSTHVLTALYENGIRYVAVRAANNDSLDMPKASELGIVVAIVPFPLSIPTAPAPADLIQYTVETTYYNLECRKKDLSSGNELTCQANLAQATIYLR